MAEQHEKEFAENFKKDADSVSPVAAKLNVYIPSVDGSGKVLEKSVTANEVMIKQHSEIWTGCRARSARLRSGPGDSSVRPQAAHRELLPQSPAMTRRPRSPFAGASSSKPSDSTRRSLPTPGPALPLGNDGLSGVYSEHYANAEAKIKAETGRDLNADEKANLAGNSWTCARRISPPLP